MIYNISFPKLFINLKINPVAFTMGFVNVHWYGIIVGIGFLVGYSYIYKNSNKFNIKNNELDKFIVIISIISVIFARLYYVIFYPGDYYIKNLHKIFCISEGGIAIYGAIIGGILSIYILCKIYKKNMLNILDLMSFGVSIGQAIGRWGNFVNQEAFGSYTNLPWGMSSENTNFQTVHPCFLYESIICLSCFLFLHFYHKYTKNIKTGEIFYLYLLIYSTGRVLIESLRTDSLYIYNTNIKISQFLGVILIIFSSYKIVKNKLK